MAWWDQGRIADATAIVAGAGALGNEVLKNLALLGWGRIIAVDFDVVETSNLTRSVLFRARDVGRRKTAAAAEALQAMNPDCAVEQLHGDLRAVLSSGIVRRAAVVFGCVDNLAARLALNSLAGQVGVLFIDGGLTEWEGTVSVFRPDNGPCFACGLTGTDLHELRLRHSCPAFAARARAQGGVATTPTLASIIAALMVQQGLKHLHGITDPLRLPEGRQLRIDTAFNRFWNVEFWRNPDCALHPELERADTVEGLTDRSTWVEILNGARALCGDSGAVLHLPHAVVGSWSCAQCGAAESDSPQLLLTGEERACPACAHVITPTLYNQVTGSETWLHTSPHDCGFPPLTWLALIHSQGIQNLELGSRSDTHV